MIPTIIFDFMRTLHVPRAGVDAETCLMLARLGQKKACLGLITRKEGQRERQVSDIAPLFDAVLFVEEKSPDAFLKMIAMLGGRVETTYIVGDRLDDEIRIAGEIGAIPIWLVPEGEPPPRGYAISSLTELEATLTAHAESSQFSEENEEVKRENQRKP